MNMRKRFLSLLFLCMVLCGSVFSAIPSKASAGTVTGYEKIHWGVYTGRYYVNGIHAFCAAYSMTSPGVGTGIESITPCENELIRKALYYGYNGPQNTLGTDAKAHVLTAIAISDANIGVKASGIRDIYHEFYYELFENPEKYPSPPWYFHAYLAKPKGTGYQTLAFYELEPVQRVDVLIQKIDAATGKNEPQGTASLQDARFEVCYYKGFMEDGEEADRTWIFATDDTGTVRMNKEYLVEGEPLFDAAFPLGTITVRELQASKGYQLNDTLFVRELRQPGDFAPVVVEEEKKQPFALVIHKLDDYGNRLEGAEFALYADSNCQERMAEGFTNREGILRFENLEAETHYYLREIKAPAGYAMVEGEGAYAYEIYAEGTPENQEYHMEILNEAIIVLPKTGSIKTLLIPMFGAVLCIISLYFTAKKRRTNI